MMSKVVIFPFFLFHDKSAKRKNLWMITQPLLEIPIIPTIANEHLVQQISEIIQMLIKKVMFFWFEHGVLQLVKSCQTQMCNILVLKKLQIMTVLGVKQMPFLNGNICQASKEIFCAEAKN